MKLAVIGLIFSIIINVANAQDSTLLQSNNSSTALQTSNATIKNDIIIIIDKILVFNNLDAFLNQKTGRRIKKEEYHYLQEGQFYVYENEKLINIDSFYSHSITIRISIETNKTYKIQVSGNNCYPAYTIVLNTTNYNLEGRQRILIGSSEQEEVDYVGKSMIIPTMIKFNSAAELNKYQVALSEAELNNEIDIVYESEKKEFIVTSKNAVDNSDQEKHSLLNYKEIKDKWKETINTLIDKVDFIKKDTIEEDSKIDSAVILTSKKSEAKPVINTEKIKSASTQKSTTSEERSSSIYSFLADFEKMELKSESLTDTTKLEEKKKFVVQQQNKINDGWKNAKTREDTLMLLTAEQQLKNVQESLNLMEDKLKKSDELAISNQKLFEEEKLRTAAIKSRNQYLYAGMTIAGILILIIIYFLLKSKKLNDKVKRTLTQVEEQNEELNQTNEELAAQRDQIEHQRHNLEVAHIEIKDSINYAKRIQKAILPGPIIFSELLPNHLILYRPKDVVAGDFYWLEQSEDATLFAAADCTGHGVPGAMVSVVCHNALNRVVHEFKLSEPGEILDKAREIVLKEFSKSEDNVQDGMDIALCSINGNVLKYAGANNPLWMIRDGELIETKADKQPIGKFDKVKSFKTHTIELEKDDLIYIFTDGYQDQFGGDRDRKFGTKRLKELIRSIHHHPLAKQKEILDLQLNEWMKTCQIGQLDDICMIGVRI